MQVFNSTSVLVIWKPIPVEFRHGIITKYTILYKDLKRESNNLTDVEAPASNATINGLRQKANYSFQIQAATSKGNGPFSTPPETAATKGE